MSEETTQTAENAEEINDLHEQVREKIQCCENVNSMYCGQVTQMDDGFASSYLSVINELSCDSQGLAHAGFLYSAAIYLAQVALQQPNTFTLQSRVHYLAPVRTGDMVMFEAACRLEKTKRPEVVVKAYVRDICVFEGQFFVLVSGEHVLQLQESELKKYQARILEATAR